MNKEVSERGREGERRKHGRGAKRERLKSLIFDGQEGADVSGKGQTALPLLPPVSVFVKQGRSRRSRPGLLMQQARHTRTST